MSRSQTVSDFDEKENHSATQGSGVVAFAGLTIRACSGQSHDLPWNKLRTMVGIRLV
jgi:hypothetical protein